MVRYFSKELQVWKKPPVVYMFLSAETFHHNSLMQTVYWHCYYDCKHWSQQLLVGVPVFSVFIASWNNLKWSIQMCEKFACRLVDSEIWPGSHFTCCQFENNILLSNCLLCMLYKCSNFRILFHEIKSWLIF